MPLNDEAIRGLKFAPVTEDYTARDTALYGLATGAAQRDPLDPEELKYASEMNLVALPTMVATLGLGDATWMQDPAFGISFANLLHGEERLVFHRPLAAEGRLTARTTIDGIYDKGPGKAAVLVMTRRLADAETGAPVADVGSSLFLRGDGGFGGSQDGGPKPAALPAGKAADFTLDFPTRPDQALLFNLCLPSHPIHFDPAVARAAGFDRPILHGVCGSAAVCRGLIAALCDGDPARLTRFDVRFSAPAYPGETIRAEIWRDGPGRALFRAAVAERGVTILNNGLVAFRA